MADPVEVLRINRQQAKQLALRIGGKAVRSLLTDAADDLRKRLSASIRTGSTAPTSEREMRIALAQVEDVARATARQIGRTAATTAGKAAEVGASGLARYLAQAQARYGSKAAPLAIREGAMLRRAVQGAESTVLRRLATTEQALAASATSLDSLAGEPARIQLTNPTSVLSRYSMQTIGEFEGVLSTAVVTRKPWGDVRDALVEKSPFLQGAPGAWAERIVRTETMGAYNRAGWESIRSADDDLGDMVKILSATFDARTGWDSYQVHGQIRLPDEAFAWAGGFYQHPPNRPNDREIVVPHRLSWPLPPELSWRADSEVMAAWLRDRRKGAPPPRPKMTTVPLSRFG